MAIGNTRASPPISEAIGLVGQRRLRPVRECVPIRENKCLPAEQAPLVLGGLAVGIRGRSGSGDNAAGAALAASSTLGRFVVPPGRQPGGARRRDDLEAGRKSGCASPRRCAADHRRRHLRGAGASGAGPRPEHAGSTARYRRARTEGLLSAGIADGRGRDRCLARVARRGRRDDLQYRAGQIWRPGRPVMPAAMAAAIAAAGARTPVNHFRNEKSRAIGRLSDASNCSSGDQCVTVTVVPTDTR